MIRKIGIHFQKLQWILAIKRVLYKVIALNEEGAYGIINCYYDYSNTYNYSYSR